MIAIQDKARELWQSMSKDQQALVRFGMFDVDIMKPAEAEGYNGKDLAVALMSEAKAHGGMEA